MTQALKKYNPEDYQFEKIIGKRGSTGELKLKRLKGIHRTIIGYHLRGLSNRDISFITGHTEITISRVLRDPLSQAYINTIIDGAEMELEALAPMAVSAIRDGLEADKSDATRLKAADRFFRATGRYDRKKDDGETAEDVIARALKVMQKQANALDNLSRPDPTARLVEVNPITAGLIEDQSQEEN